MLLLSKGRVIYAGTSSGAASFFMEQSVSLSLVSSGYTNPADFLADVSGCMVKNKEVCIYNKIIY